MAKRPGTVPILRDVKTRSAKLAPSQSHRRPNGQRGRPQAASAGLVPAPVAAPVAGLTGVAGPLEEPAPAVLPGRQAAWMGARSRSIREVLACSPIQLPRDGAERFGVA